MTWHIVVALSLALIPIVLAPGTSAVLVARYAATGGPRDVLSVLAGTATGLYLHATFAALGLSALVMASATALSVVRAVGAVYLIGLGVYLLAKPMRQPPPRADTEPGTKVYAQALAGNLINPKAALVYLTLPVQFLQPGDSPAAAAFMLATLHILMLVPWLSMWAFVIGSAKRSRRLASITSAVGRGGGLLLIGLGVRSAVSS